MRKIVKVNGEKICRNKSILCIIQLICYCKIIKIILCFSFIHLKYILIHAFQFFKEYRVVLRIYT